MLTEHTPDSTVIAMKVTRKSKDHLVLGDVPWFLSLALVAMVVGFLYAAFNEFNGGEFWQGMAVLVLGAGLSLAGLIAFARRSQAVFNRVEGRITRRSRSFLGYKEEHWPLADVERAIVQKLNDTDGDTYRPALLMRRGERHVPLMLIYASGSGADRAVQAINEWLAAVDSEPKAS